MQRVYMVPEKEYQLPPPKLFLPSPNNPTTSLESQLQQLNATPNLSKDARWREYERIFNSFFSFTKKTPTSFPSATMTEESTIKSMADILHHLVDSDEPEKIISPIYHTLPKSVREKGLQLILFMSQTPDVQNKTYQVSRSGHIKISGQEISGSNLLDLVHYAVRPKRKITEPHGWTQFLDFLRRNNVPAELLAQHHRSLPGRFPVPGGARKVVIKPATPQVEMSQFKPLHALKDIPTVHVPATPEVFSTPPLPRRLRVRAPPPYPPVIKKKKKRQAQTGSSHKYRWPDLWWSVDH